MRWDCSTTWRKAIRQGSIGVQFQFHLFSNDDLVKRGAVVRVLTYSDTRVMGGRTIPTRRKMRPTAKPGNVTTIGLRCIRCDEPTGAGIFTQRTLTRR